MQKVRKLRFSDRSNKLWLGCYKPNLASYNDHDLETFIPNCTGYKFHGYSHYSLNFHCTKVAIPFFDNRGLRTNMHNSINFMGYLLPSTNTSITQLCPARLRQMGRNNLVSL